MGVTPFQMVNELCGTLLKSPCSSSFLFCFKQVDQIYCWCQCMSKIFCNFMAVHFAHSHCCVTLLQIFLIIIFFWFVFYDRVIIRILWYLFFRWTAHSQLENASATWMRITLRSPENGKPCHGDRWKVGGTLEMDISLDRREHKLEFPPRLPIFQPLHFMPRQPGTITNGGICNLG